MPVKYFLLCNISICYFLKMINNKNMTDDKILQNLKDANCTSDFIAKFFELTGKTQEQVKLLSTHRVWLLDELHVSQKRIDCLDYLIFTLNQSKC